MRKSTSGFTLVELIVSIAVGAIVMGAALSFLLMGMRMQSRSYETASQQNTIRVVMTLAENLAKEGEITEVEHNDPDAGDWSIADGAIWYDWSENDLYIRGTVVMSDLTNATANMDGRLFTLSIETEYGEYTTSVYCRTAAPTPVMMYAAPKKVSPDDGREAFLSILREQIGSTGEIVGSFEYFSEWYIKQQYEVTPFGGDNEWNENTPWCACFISWAAAQIGEEYLNTVPYFADVSKGAAKFQDDGCWKDFSYTPLPGDLIFFNLDNDPAPDHVGAVLSVDTINNIVITIEGNSSNEHDVKIVEYPLNSSEILGYSVLAWTTQ